jgi:DNA polymerase III alpha subunit
MPYADVDKVAKQIPAALDMTLEKALDESEPLRQMEQAIQGEGTAGGRPRSRG